MGLVRGRYCMAAHPQALPSFPHMAAFYQAVNQNKRAASNIKDKRA